MTTEEIRNKYNTLTPAEAKKLNRYLGGRPPVRTASVLHRPRAPPIVVTDLDNTIERQLLDDGHGSDGQAASLRGQLADMHSLSRTTSGCDRRHSVNYGRASMLTSRQSLFSTASAKNQYQHQPVQQNVKISSHDSFSNLSFRSSKDVPDFGPESESRFQTMSVDLSSQKQTRPATAAFDVMRARLRHGSQKSNTINTRFSDDSFSSARSDMSNHIANRSSSATPTKFTHFPTVPLNEPQSVSKLSLSSSTYKVLQSPLANFKKLFRGIHRPFGQTSSKAHVQTQPTKEERQQCNQSLADLSLSDSLSRISLNKSQSPTILPPPPDELKSMCYLEGGLNYSNYDDFTRARNERLPKSNLHNLTRRGDVPNRPDGKGTTNTFGNHLEHASNFNKCDDSDDSSWQMTSLPVYFERNLTTVFEEKQTPCMDVVASSRRNQVLTGDFDQNLNTEVEDIYQTIKPPRKFSNTQQTQSSLETDCPRAASADSHCGPLSFSIFSESALETQRRQPATPFRFSFAQPLSNAEQGTLNANLGLPPRMPVIQQQASAATSLINSETQQQDNSSSGNSSNCSSQVNGINYCDRQNSMSSSEHTAAQTNDKLSFSISSSGGFGNLSIDDPDSTILSESSTIREETGATFYANKCAELERTVTNLKNKLIGKEKELTDLQLSQLNNDYTIERLKKQVNKLERENAQLRTMVAKNSNNAITTGSNTISRMQI